MRERRREGGRKFACNSPLKTMLTSYTRLTRIHVHEQDDRQVDCRQANIQADNKHNIKQHENIVKKMLHLCSTSRTVVPTRLYVPALIKRTQKSILSRPHFSSTDKHDAAHSCYCYWDIRPTSDAIYRRKSCRPN